MSAEIVRQFATALDDENYDCAITLLSPICNYLCRGREYHGPEAIIDAYQGTGDSAKEILDQIEYESEVVEVSEREAMIHFIDRLTHQGKAFTFRCQQRTTLDERGKIVRIEQIDLPGQREALAEFMKNAGIEWKSPAG